MFEVLRWFVTSFRAYFRSRNDLQTEILALRHGDRCPSATESQAQAETRGSPFLGRAIPILVVKPASVIDWHRRGFRCYWTWKVRHGHAGRPCVAKETRELIRTLSRDNVGWGAPRIHSELLKLGIKISESSISKYLVRHPKPPSKRGGHS
jgi:hypothetical protein